ncbi:hypothetical protein ACIRL2_40520 [Embleya sp. NPDC127516]|uniref:hypothetical protein n=1 Tax=Embleya sp. NPDC127516 TaxID=3363990 RepID=UPI003820BECF
MSSTANTAEAAAIWTTMLSAVMRIAPGNPSPVVAPARVMGNGRDVHGTDRVVGPESGTGKRRECDTVDGNQHHDVSPDQRRD